jgi:HD superfamily phosphohydrolase
MQSYIALSYQKKVLNTIVQLFAVRANNFREIYGHRVAKAIEFMYMDVLKLVAADLNLAQRAIDPALFITLDDSLIRCGALV